MNHRKTGSFAVTVDVWGEHYQQIIARSKAPGTLATAWAVLPKPIVTRPRS
jgi:hypothetical protein